MNLLSWAISLSVLVTLMIKAVTFYKATVCRQEAWLKATELTTRSLLSNSRPHERDWHLSCRLHLERKQETVTWQKLPSMTKNSFFLKVEGDL